MHKKGLLKGAKIARSHSTLIPEAGELVARIKILDSVEKLVIGVITPVKPGTPRLKFYSIRAGLQMIVRGRAGQQIIYIYTKESDRVRERILSFWKFDT